MKLMIDANIILDVLQARKPHLRDSALVWKLCETDQDTGYVSALSFANLVYVMRKELDPEGIENVFRQLQIIFHFTDLSAADITKAISLKWNDFEDALQSASAARLKADYIITRNVKDYVGSQIVALTPEEYLILRRMGR